MAEWFKTELLLNRIINQNDDNIAHLNDQQFYQKYKIQQDPQDEK